MWPSRWKSFLPRGRSHGTTMLEIRRGRCRAAENSRIERAASRCEQRERDETAADLEAEAADVVVRHAVAREVNDRPEQERERPRARECTGRRAGRDVKRDDHNVMIAHSGPLASETVCREVWSA